jgi:hypothetical protein
MIYISFSKDWLRQREIGFIRVKSLLCKFYSQMLIQIIISLLENIIKLMMLQILKGPVPWKISKIIKRIFSLK